MTVAALTGVSKSYGAQQILHGIDLAIGSGEIVALVGRSGSGKSTILRILAGLSDDHSGVVSVTGSRAVAFQEPRLFPWKSVARNVSYGVPGQRDDHRVRETLEEVGLADKGSAWPLTLSGGQAQRVALARALAGRPELLLLDEPFGALDALTRLSMHELLLTLWREHRFGVLLVTHDVDEAITLADRVVVLEAGAIAANTEVNVPRPRDRASPHYADLRRHILDLLGVVERSAM